MIARPILATAALVLISASALAATTPRSLYSAALAREQSVRAAMAARKPPATLAASARAVVAAYQRMVTRFPASGYTDNALWQAGHLSIDLFLRFNQPEDRAAGVRLLRLLVDGYGSSSLTKLVPGELARLGGRMARRDAVPTVTPAATPPVAVPGPPSISGVRSPLLPETLPSNHPGALPPGAAAPSRPSAKLATIKAIRRVVLGETVRITIELDGEVSFRDERSGSPLRVFVDLPHTQAAPALLDRTLRFDADRDVVRQVQLGRSLDDATRIAVDAAGVSSYSVYPLYSPYRLVIDFIRGIEPSAAKPLVALASRRLPFDLRGSLPRTSPRTTALIAEALKPPVVVVPTLASRSLRLEWARTLPTASRGSTALITAALKAPAPTPTLLASRKLRPEWSRTLPAAPPLAAGLIAAAVKPAIGPSLIASRKLGPEWSRSLPTARPRATALIADATRPAVIAPVAAPPLPVVEAALPSPNVSESPAQPAKKPGGGYSMARQLGLSVSRIVIDPGHGGHDPGAQGSSINESELVLDIALRLEKLLQEVPGTEIILTRRTDDFVSLPERTAIANRENADLFLSIHANASDRPAASGVETYFLNFASNLSAASVAARENAASGQAMGALPDLLKAIALNNKLDESRDFAAEVQRAMIDRLRGPNKSVRNLGVKQAPFAVLIGAAMPSVLAEVSFVTNASEARLLRTSAYREHIAQALFRAIRSYQTSLKNVGTVVAAGPR